MNPNFKLFFYGMLGSVLIVMGVISILWGILFLNIHYVTGDSMVYPAIGLIVGVAMGFYGGALRFDYQRQSGNIIHAGDG